MCDDWLQMPQAGMSFRSHIGPSGENLATDAEEKSYYQCKCAFGAVCGGQELVSTAGVCVCETACNSAGRGSPGWCLLHYFLWVFLCCIIVHVSPSVIISKATVETKGPLQTSFHLQFSASVEKRSPQITCSTFIHDVIVSTFPVCIAGEERQRVRRDSPGDLFQHCCSSCMVQLLSYESTLVGWRTLESPWKPFLASKTGVHRRLSVQIGFSQCCVIRTLLAKCACVGQFCWKFPTADEEDFRNKHSCSLQQFKSQF